MIYRPSSLKGAPDFRMIDGQSGQDTLKGAFRSLITRSQPPARPLSLTLRFVVVLLVNKTCTHVVTVGPGVMRPKAGAKPVQSRCKAGANPVGTGLAPGLERDRTGFASAGVRISNRTPAPLVVTSKRG
jgi:hypothetical protein